MKPGAVVLNFSRAAGWSKTSASPGARCESGQLSKYVCDFPGLFAAGGAAARE